jgi:hypothetical protein
MISHEFAVTLRKKLRNIFEDLSSGAQLFGARAQIVVAVCVFSKTAGTGIALESDTRRGVGPRTPAGSGWH